MVKKTYIKSSDNKEEANIWRKGLRGCRQRKKKEKTNKNTERACVTKCQTHTLFPRSFNQTKCGNSTLTWRILQPSWTCPWYSSVNSTVSGNLLLFSPLLPAEKHSVLCFEVQNTTGQHCQMKLLLLYYFTNCVPAKPPGAFPSW